jgi:putative DNA primase/helicase
MGAAMRAKGCGYAEILAALWEVNQNRCEEPGPRANIEKLAASIVDRYPAGSKQTEQKTAGPSEPAPDLIPFHFADTGNADRIVALHNRRLRYCYAFRKWLYWDGTRWVTDECGHAIKLVKTSMIAFLRQAVDAASKEAETFARASLDLRRLNAALCLAQSELPIMPGDLDRDLSLLNFNNGVVDLRTGNLSPHRVDHWITKMVHFSYRPDAKCPRWLAFLSEIMGGSDELVDYLQLALGYSITGEASEKAVFVAYGSGDNGKTTLLSVVRELIHEYAVTVGLDLLTTKDSNNNVDAARAKLMGARFASSSETEEGQRLSAARLKRICQGPGGEIEACRKYENPIVFRESHKLWIDANHRPDLPATDAAVWIRLHLIPFTVTIPKDQQDRQLTQLLLGEAEGILAWLVDGAQRWYAEGLSQSKTVSAATAAWRDELNRLAAYLDEHTQKDANDQAYLRNSSLYEAYKSWAEGNGERFLSQPKFTAQMEAMGYRRKREKDGYVWYGIRFK